MSIATLDDITNAFYINLEHREDRKTHVEAELNKIGVAAQRFNAIKMKNGAIGCSMSHLKILEDAHKNHLEHVLIIEDDITFLKPDKFKKHINKFFERQGNNWDVVLFAGNNIPPYKSIDNTCIQVSHCQTTTGYLVNGHYIQTLAANVKAGLTHLLNNPENKRDFAIDRYWFHLQEKDRWFFIIPPTVIQREDYSDIEKRVTNYQNLMQDLDKERFFKNVKSKL